MIKEQINKHISKHEYIFQQHNALYATKITFILLFFAYFLEIKNY